MEVEHETSTNMAVVYNYCGNFSYGSDNMCVGVRTGWPPGLLQDDCSGLSKWFASRIDARYIVRMVCQSLSNMSPAHDAEAGTI